MRWAIVVNPYSGKKKGLALAHEIKREAAERGIESIWICGSSAAESHDLLVDAVADFNLTGVVVVGGDGLVNLAIQVLALSKIPMAVLAAGTGNDFARANGTANFSPKQLVEHMITTAPVEVDLGSATVGGTTSWFGQVMSTGFDSEVNERANRFTTIKGQIKYDLAILLELPKFSPKSYRIVADERELTVKAMLVAIANGPTYGGGMKVCPNANRSDGMFDVLLLHPIPKWEFIKVFPKVFKGTHVSHPKVEIFRCRTISIEAEAVAYADGERYGNLPLKATTHPQSLLTWVA